VSQGRISPSAFPPPLSPVTCVERIEATAARPRLLFLFPSLIVFFLQASSIMDCILMSRPRRLSNSITFTFSFVHLVFAGFSILSPSATYYSSVYDMKVNAIALTFSSFPLRWPRKPEKKKIDVPKRSLSSFPLVKVECVFIFPLFSRGVAACSPQSPQ